MGIFDIFKRKTVDEVFEINDADISEMILISKAAFSMACPEIEETGSFLPFGAAVIGETFQKVVYYDPSVTMVDHRAHATNIQNIVAEKYQHPECHFCYMAWDGVMHLKTGDIDAIFLRVSKKSKNIHRLFTYPYRVIEGKVEFEDIDNPIVSEI